LNPNSIKTINYLEKEARNYALADSAELKYMKYLSEKLRTLKSKI